MQSEQFTREEAEARVGQRIRARVAFSGVPQGTVGLVARADRMGRSLIHGGEPKEVYDVVIVWDLPARPATIQNVLVGDEVATLIQTGRPLEDWFTKGEYTRYLEEI